MIELTAGERRWVEWALGALPDFWCTEHGAHERGSETIYSEDVLPRTEKAGLDLRDAPNEIVVDIVIRLEQDAPNVAQTDALTEAAAVNRAKPALRAAEKIRAERPDVTGTW